MSAFDASHSRAERALIDFVSRLAAGEALDFRTYCRSQPALEASLFGQEGESVFLDHLWRKYGNVSAPGEAAHPVAGSAAAGSSAAGSAESSGTELVPGKYALEGELARGGMGTILRVFDQGLRRTLAMKVMLDSGSGRGASPRVISRFLDEAQITGQLEHPGIVPVHELGVDASGRLYFTMRLVRGHDLRTIFEWTRAGKNGWTFTRALGALQKVCEAVAFAHSRGVIHRDLKPANIMVGSYGETYVMDWGLAKVLDESEAATGTPATSPAAELIATDRRDASARSADSALLTQVGTVLGTPSYMAPEQARGELEQLGPRTDVYAVGAMLYTLLTGRLPFVAPGEELDAEAIVERVRQGPPPRAAAINRAASPELIAICERAMARTPADRYADMREMADDLRAYLEQRVVRAYQTGAVAEFRKWVVRNRATAATLAVLLVCVIGGTAAFSWYAQARYKEIVELADLKVLADLEAEAQELYPGHPHLEQALDVWLDRARALVPRLVQHRAALAEVRAQALPYDDAARARDIATHPKRAELDDLERRRNAAKNDPLAKVPERFDQAIESLATEVAQRRSYIFASDLLRWQHQTLIDLVNGIEKLSTPETGLLSEIEKRLRLAVRVKDVTIDSAEATAAWRAAVADVSQLPAYSGLRLTAQIGLLPLGRDPQSGLWEFWHVASGDRPQRSASGPSAWQMDEATGMVFVLVPANTFVMGAIKPTAAASKGPNIDSATNDTTQPLNSISLDAYFLSKYEMTQGQWRRATGKNPSRHSPGAVFEGKTTDLRNPIEMISWWDAEDTLSHLGLELPTEAQWECATRAGTTTVWWTGDDRETLRGALNMACQSLARNQPNFKDAADAWKDFEDGFAVHAPVGSFRPNPFGFHDVCGNVWEWCRDWYDLYSLPTAPRDGERLGLQRENRVARGGCFNNKVEGVRSAQRGFAVPSYRQYSFGVRPMRRVE